MVDVDRDRGRIVVHGPAGVSAAPNDAPGPSLSIVGGDAVVIDASSFSATGVGSGGAPPGKVLVRFDLALTNRLGGTRLVRPTFPIPPDPVASSVYLFPLEAIPTTTTGSVTSAGNDVIVEQPNYGGVVASADFDGAPHNFFNDGGCPSGANDCFRYEAYPAPVSGGATTAGRQVGFVIDPTVGTFRARFLVVADLENEVTVPQAAIVGTVRSPQLGYLDGVTVRLSNGVTAQTGFPGGVFQLDLRNSHLGPYSIWLEGLPAGCAPPASQHVMIPANPGGIPITTIDFVVDCGGIAGFDVSGTLQVPGAGSLVGSAVSLLGSGAPITVLTSGSGAWAITNVPPGSYVATATGLPSGCKAIAATVTVSSDVSGVVVDAACGPPGITVDGAVAFAPGSATPPLGLALVLAKGVVLAVPSSGGGFQLVDVPVDSGATVSNGAVGIGNLPPSCTSSPAVPFSVPSGGTFDAGTFTVSCGQASYYPLRGEWSVVGASAELTVWIDLNAWNDPGNNGSGPDAMGAYQMQLTYPEARMTVQSCSGVPGWTFVLNGFNPGAVILGAFTTSPSGGGGARIELARCAFVVRPGPTAQVLLSRFFVGSPQFLPVTPIAGSIDPLP
ncbi:MAG: hypothetical protein R2909_09770 [Gemmatimonadales bacterium]